IRGKALVLHLLHRYPEALELYHRLLSRHPESDELLTSAMAASLAHGDFELLANYSRRLLMIQPGARVALECLALAAAARRDYDRAMQQCQALLEAHTDSFAGWFNSGVALQKLGRYSEAVEAYSHAVRIDPRSCEAHVSLGAVLHELERWEDA